jgi:hypothetical protein
VKSWNVTLHGIVSRARLLHLVLASVLFLGLLSPPMGFGQTPSGPVARAVSVQGLVEARRAGQAPWQPVRLNDTFSPGDTIRVHDRSRADIAMLDQSVLRLNANTEMTVEPVKDQGTGVVNLLRGAAHFFSRGPRSLEVQTPFTVAGVRGTEFFIGLEPNQALLTVFEGTVVAQNPSGSLTLTSGQSAVAETGRAPVLRVVAHPRDAVQWTLHYPPVLYFRPGGTLSLLVAQRHAAVIARAMAGHFHQARALLDSPAHGQPADSVPTGGSRGPGRRFTRDEVVELLLAAGFDVGAIHGVRVFADLVPGSLLDLEPGATQALVELEKAVAERAEYLPLATQLHVIATR